MVKGIVDETFTFGAQVNETKEFTVGLIVCTEHPQLRKAYERAQSLGLTGVAEQIAKVCEYLEGKSQKVKVMRAESIEM